DAQIVSDGKVVTAYDASTNTAYRFALPQDKATAKPEPHTPPTLAKIDEAIANISKHWSLSGATPTSTAGAPTYTVRIAPPRVRRRRPQTPRSHAPRRPRTPPRSRPWRRRAAGAPGPRPPAGRAPAGPPPATPSPARPDPNAAPPPAAAKRNRPLLTPISRP